MANTDHYLPCDAYQNRQADSGSSFAKWQDTDGNYYFSMLSASGNLLMRSESYPTESGRDNGADSVSRNRDIEARYSVVEDGGEWFVTLKAGNHQEIARSCGFGSEAAAQAHVATCNSAYVEVVASSAKSVEMSAGGSGQDEYLPCEAYAGAAASSQAGFTAFEANGEYYFAYVGDGNTVILRSEGYKTPSARDNGIESVKRNMDIQERWVEREDEDGNYYALLAGNRQEIARTCPFESASARGGWWSRWSSTAFVAGGAAAASAAVVSESRTVEAAAPEVVETASASVETASVAVEATAPEVVETASVAVEVSAPEVVETASVTVEAAAPEVVETASVAVEAAAPEVVETAAASVETSSIAAESTTIVEKRTIKVEHVEDDYLPCKEYEGHAVNDKQNNIAYFKHSNGQFYFVVYNADGSVRLRSEGFPTGHQRDEEVSGVIKNLHNADMYKVLENGPYAMRVLYDKTGREVGRSCLEKKAVEAAPVVVEAAPVVETVAAVAAVAAAPVVVEAIVERVEAPAPVVEEVVVAAPVVEEVKVEAPIVETIVAAAVAAPVVETIVEKVVTTKVEKEDDYLPCKEYEGHSVSDKANNIAFFTGKDGQMYFVVYKADGSVRLRSEGFSDTKSRDEELAGVIKHLNDNDMYKVLENGPYTMRVLYDKTGREVGRSCLEKKVEAAPVVETIAAVAAVAAVAPVAKEVVQEVVTKKVTDKEDDYLPCKDYEGHKVSDKQNNVAFFKGKDGQHYFVVYKADGTVRLRSEGFRNTQERDSELAAVLKHLNNHDMYKVLENGPYTMRVLYDKAGREVGRSCLEKRVEAVPVVETVAAVAAVAAVVNEVKEEKTVVYTKPVKETVVAAAPVVEEAAAGGFNWMWLLPLLLIPLLWFTCNKCKKPEAPAVKVEVPAAAAPAPAAPAPAAPTCSCTGNDNPLFNMPAGATPKTLTKLGTSPEFGSLHGLTAKEVYERMSRWHKKHASTRKFMDDAFKSMGYANGFADAKADMFTEAVVTSGTTGNMGFGGERHKTIYATLSPVSDRDLQAFRIKSANGCDLHFMKTCGNHFYYCPK